jgi:hypothetical protein
LCSGTATALFEWLIMHGRWEVLLELTVNDRVESVAVCLISTRLLCRAVGHTVALGVTHVGLADTTTIRAGELVNTCAVLTWWVNEDSSGLTNEGHTVK